MARKLSAAAFQRAERSIPGGVNSPVRAFGAVGADPVFVDHAAGAYVDDIDGNRYIDYIQSWGAGILGHAHPVACEAIRDAAGKGISFGLSTPAEARLAELIKEAFPSIDRLRMVNSGTEAVMSAVRLARGYTGRDMIVKFEGGYHGHSDCLLAEAGSGVATFGIPGSPGVPEAVTSMTIVLPYNDLAAVKALFRECGGDIACIVVEPVAANMGVVPPGDGFLEGLREVCNESGAVLVFDEVITGFRIAMGGAQEKYGVEADLTVLGKIIGGGLPVGAFGGKKEIMDCLAPSGSVYQAGTLSGNPVVVSAGAAVLKHLFETNPYDRLDWLGERLADGLRRVLSAARTDAVVSRVGSMLTVFFSAESPVDYSSAKAADTAAYGAFFRSMLDAGVLMAPSQFEALFLSTAHTEEDIDRTLQAAAASVLQ